MASRIRPARAEAIAFLLRELAAGEQPAPAVTERARAVGISARTLQRAREELIERELLVIVKRGFPAHSFWRLRDNESQSWPASLPHPTALGPREHLHYMNGGTSALCGQRALLPDDGRAAPWCTMCLHAAGHKPGDTLRIERLRRELQGAT